MGRFRTKPFEIEATQWFKEGDHPDVKMRFDAAAGTGEVLSQQGWVLVNPGDWIIREPCEWPRLFYPCKPEVFAAKYEPVE